MALLDRFRAQPRPKHPDAAVRLAYVAELSVDERDLIVAMAREDDDPRVRRAAVAKLTDPSALAAVARADADEGVRGQAVAMLRDIALDSFEGVSPTDSLAAVNALGDTKVLAQVARTSLKEEIGRQALARVTDVHALGSIARHAVHESIRQAALDRLQDCGEIVGVAMNSEFKDTAVSAAERLENREELEQVAAGGKNKSAAKRARSMLREMDERAAQAAAAASLPAPDPADIAHVERAPSAPIPVLLPSIDESRAAEIALEEAEAARRRDERQAVERARAEAARDQAREQARKEAEKEAERRRIRLGELVEAAEGAAADADLAAARRAITVARLEWKDLATGAAIDPEMAGRFAGADTRLTKRETDAQEADARARREALNRVRHLLGRVEPLLARTDLSLKSAERALRDVRAAIAEGSPLPSKRDHDEVVSRLKIVLAALVPKVQELRELADWQRWANVGIQEQLCEKMEALRAVEKADELGRHLRELQQQWRLAADVPRGQGEALWRRFKAAYDTVWARCEAHFAAEAQARAENGAKKTALIERAEVLANSMHWISTADEIKRMQLEWKTIGPATRGQEKTLWERFRSACDRFFTRRQEDLTKRKAMWAENLAKKEALCARAEALGESTDWDAVAAEIKRLQAEWKTLGPVKKSRSEAVWQRFRTACDQFFARYAQRHDIARAERVAAREALCAELEALALPMQDADGSNNASAAELHPDGESQAPPVDLVQHVRTLRARWQQELTARGVDHARALVLNQRFAGAFDRVLARWPAVFGGTDLDPEANRQRMEALVRRMEDLVTSLAGAAPADVALSPTTKLAAMLKEALAANTIGGKVDEGIRWRAAQEDTRQAQAAWSRIGPVADPVRRSLADRFERACRRIIDGASRPTRPTGS